jgi:hypothetical protein
MRSQAPYQPVQVSIVDDGKYPRLSVDRIWRLNRSFDQAVNGLVVHKLRLRSSTLMLIIDSGLKALWAVAHGSAATKLYELCHYSAESPAPDALADIDVDRFPVIEGAAQHRLAHAAEQAAGDLIDQLRALIVVEHLARLSICDWPASS